VAGSSTISEAFVALVAHSAVLAVVGNVKAHASRVNVAVAKDEESAEDWLGDEVKDTVKDGLGIGRDDIATLAKTKGNGVERPDDEGQAAAPDEDLADITAKVAGVLAGLENEHVPDPEESNAAKGEVAPLVLGPDESTDETGDDHDLVDQDGPHDSGPGHASGEEKIEKEERSGDEPVNLV